MLAHEADHALNRGRNNGSGADIYDNEVSGYQAQTAVYMGVGRFSSSGWVTVSPEGRQSFINRGAVGSHENVCGTPKNPTGACYAPYR